MITTSFRVTLGIALGLAVLSLVGFFTIPPVTYSANMWLYVSLLVWSTMLVLSLALALKQPVAGILLAGLCMVILVRVTGIYSFYMLNLPAVAVLVLLFMAYVTYSRVISYNIYEATVTFIRIYIGLNIAAHCAEKLFGGIMPFEQVVHAFTQLNVPMPHLFVTLAGLCEFGAAIALGLGLFTRLGAICAALYLIVATALGNHFSLGFIWANVGGGWEYPVLWIVFTLIFAVVGGGQFSLDYLIANHYKPGRWFYRISGQKYYP